jgi:hypothetical protein
MQKSMSDRAAPGSVVSTKSAIAAGASAVSSTLGRIRYSSLGSGRAKAGEVR